jgi:hypothetical protein
MNPSIIDVLVVFDVDSILEKYPTPSKDPQNPTGLNGNDIGLIHMLVKQLRVMDGASGGELRFSAKTNDIIRWREETFSDNINSDVDVQLYGFLVTQGDGLIDKPQLKNVEVKKIIGNPTDPLSPTFQTITDSFWQTTVLKPGDVTYHWRFMITDEKNDKLGYFEWDPFIHITE